MKFNPYTNKKASGVETVDRKTGAPFNPMNVGRQGKSGNFQVSAGEKMFNNQGEINASNTGEVLHKIKHLLDGMADGSYDVERTASYAGEGMSGAETDAILREAFSDPSSEGFRQVGQGLLNPIKEVIDY